MGTEHRHIPLESAAKRTSIQTTLTQTRGVLDHLYFQGLAGKDCIVEGINTRGRVFAENPTHNWYPLNGVGGLVDRWMWVG